MAVRQSSIWYGEFGGAYVAPQLVSALRRIDEAFSHAIEDESFQEELSHFLETFGGRPTPLRELPRFASSSGARIFAKREDLAHTGGNYINSAAGQCLLAKRMGCHTIVCDTGSGHNGVAAAASAAALGLNCIVFMSLADCHAEQVMVARMRMLRAEVRVVDTGSAVLSEAVSAAYQAWMAGSPGVFYLSGAPVGPAPYPKMVSYFQRMIGEEVREQLRKLSEPAPSLVVAPLGGGSTAMGLFSVFAADSNVRLCVAQSVRRSIKEPQARLGQAKLGILHGAKTLVLQDDRGSIAALHATSPGLRYPGTAPQIAELWANKRLESVLIDEDDAKVVQREIAQIEGLLVSIESSHALCGALRMAASLTAQELVIVSVNAADDGAIDLETARA